MGVILAILVAIVVIYVIYPIVKFLLETVKVVLQIIAGTIMVAAQFLALILGIACFSITALIMGILLWPFSIIINFYNPFELMDKKNESICSMLKHEIKDMSINILDLEYAIANAFKSGGYLGWIVIFKPINLIFIVIYMVLASIYSIIIGAISLLIGGTSSVLHTLVYYALSFVLRRVFYTISRTIERNKLVIYKKLDNREKLKNKQKALYGYSLKPIVSEVYSACFIFSYNLISFITIVLPIALHSLLFLVLSPLTITYYLIFKLSEDIYYKINNLSTICSSCFNTMRIPDCKCPGCGQIHHDLTPSFTHVLYKKCECGKWISSSIFTGRKKLQSECSKCHSSIIVKEIKNICIPVLGAPNAGKTCFTLSALNNYLTMDCPLEGRYASFFSRAAETQFNRLMQDMSRGIMPPKTPIWGQFDFNLLISGRKDKWSRGLFLLDLAGEETKSSKALSKYNFFQYCNGYVIVIDPVSIIGLSKIKAHNNMALEEVAVSMESLSDILDTMILNLEKNFGVKVDQKINEPCAVVINKIDLSGLRKEIGLEVLKSYELNKISLLCKKFLEENKEGYFVKKLEDKFTHIKFFPCSAIHDVDNKEKPQSYSSMEPLKWILKNVDKNLA